MLPATDPARTIVNAPVLRVGCPMWAHQPWQGRYLPDGLRRGEQLAAYATWCNAVEGNTTFYGAPAADTVASWATHAPDGFRFMFKLPRTITHERRLRDAGDETRAFLRLLEPLDRRADPISIQLPGSFGPAQLGDLARFVSTLPGTHRFAVEVRHPAFFDGSPAERALARLLGDHGLEWIGFDTTTLFAEPPTSDGERDAWSNKPRVPVRTRALTDRPIVRYIGRDDPERTAAGWQHWIPVVAAWLEAGSTPTFFVHTPDNLESLVLARRFHADVRSVVPELEPLPEPNRPEPTTLF